MKPFRVDLFYFNCLLSFQKLLQSIFSAVSYLERRLPGLLNPYAVAMASYALANENKLNKETLYRFAAPGCVYTALLQKITSSEN